MYKSQYPFGRPEANIKTQFAFGLLISILISPVLTRQNGLSLVSDQGSTFIYNCSVVGEGQTVWTGSAFDCPDKNDSIILRHSEFLTYNSSSTAGTCNNGTIFGEAISVEGDCFTSRLLIFATSGLDGKYITCIHENGSSELIIGVAELYIVGPSLSASVVSGTVLGVTISLGILVVIIGTVGMMVGLIEDRRKLLYRPITRGLNVTSNPLIELHNPPIAADTETTKGILTDMVAPGDENLKGSSSAVTHTSHSLTNDEVTRMLQIHFFDRQLLECDCSSKKYTLDGHEITIIIPEGAVAEGEKVHFEVCVAMYGPFIFPENTQPISPILWLYPMEANIELKKPLQVIIPHCVAGLTKDGLHQHQVCFIKSDCKDRDANGYYHFSQCSSNNNFLFEGYGVLETSCFGLFGFAKLRCTSEISVRYCLARVCLPPSPPTYTFHLYVIYNLPTHKKVLEMQLDEHSVIYYKDFLFQHKDGSFLKLLTSEIPAELEPVTGEIKECDVNFWETDYQVFREQLDNHDYPPKIKLTVRQTQSGSQVSYPIRFVGCTTNFAIDLLLSTDAELFEEAMQNGFVSMRAIALLLIGVAGAGKTSFCNLILDKSPDVRRSTPLAKSSIRAMSTSKAIVTKAAESTQREEEGIFWKHVMQLEFRSLIAGAIKESKWSDHQHQLAINKEDRPKVSYLTALKNLEPSDFYKWMQKKRSEQQDTKPLFSEQDDDEQQKLLIMGKSTIQEVEFSKSDVELHTSEQIVPAGSSHIKKIFESESMLELFKLIANSKGSIELLRQEWLYITDTGGQPQFHELLPTFVRHVSAAAFFVKLNEKLMDHPMIEYYNEHGELCGQPYESAHNHLQIIQNCLQAMQWRHEIDGNPQCPELFFVGTHRDLENEQETIELKNKCLKDELQQHDTFRRHLAYCSVGKSDHLLYSVNAKNPDETDKKTAANFRQDMVRRCRENAHEYKIPIRWFVLEMLLQELSNDGVISYQECLDVANRLKMDERRLQAAIDYLIKLNVFEYFPKILPGVVFTTSQVLLTKVTELVEYSHELHSSSSSNRDSIDIDFRDYGKITVRMLERKRFSRHFVKGLFEPKHLLNLLKELLVAAKKGPNDITVTVPAVLSNLQPLELSKHRLDIKSLSLEPIAVHYPGGLFPSGIFSSLISHLQNKSKWQIMMVHGEPVCLKKNCTKFSISSDVTANVTLIYSHNWIELHATIFDEEQHKACLLRDDLFKGLKHAETVQKYKNMQPKLAFFCDCQGEYYQHLGCAISEKFMRCSVNNGVCKPLTVRHRLWLKSLESSKYVLNSTRQEKDAYSMSIKSETKDDDQYEEDSCKRYIESESELELKDVFAVLLPLATHWKSIGTLLGIQKHVLDRIKSDEAGVNNCLQEMLSEWLKQVNPSPTWKDLANAVEKIDQSKAQEIRSRF